MMQRRTDIITNPALAASSNKLKTASVKRKIQLILPIVLLWMLSGVTDSAAERRITVGFHENTPVLLDSRLPRVL